MTVDQTVTNLTPEQEAVFRTIQCQHPLYAGCGCHWQMEVSIKTTGLHYEGYLCMAKIQRLVEPNDCYMEVLKREGELG